MAGHVYSESFSHHAHHFCLQPRDMKKDPRIGEAKNLMRRKRIQLEHQREYDEAIVTLKQKVNGRVWMMERRDPMSVTTFTFLNSAF